MTDRVNEKKTLDSKRVKYIIGQVALIVLMAIVTLCVVYPMLFVISTSFKTYGEFVKEPFAITFNHPENYVKAWVEGNLGRSILNSATVAVVAVVCQVLITGCCIFAMGVLRFKGSGLIMGVLLFTMFVSGEMTTVPNIILIRKLNLYDTLGALLFPAALGLSAIGVMLGDGYCKAIPEEMHESANLDGATVPQMFLLIDLPLLKPVLTYVAIGSFGGAWSDFFGPLIYLPTNKEAHTLAITIQQFNTQNNSEYGTLCAALCILAAPVVLVYSIFSKYFLEGVAVGAVKG